MYLGWLCRGFRRDSDRVQVPPKRCFLPVIRFGSLVGKARRFIIPNRPSMRRRRPEFDSRRAQSPLGCAWAAWRRTKGLCQEPGAWVCREESRYAEKKVRILPEASQLLFLSAVPVPMGLSPNRLCMEHPCEFLTSFVSIRTPSDIQRGGGGVKYQRCVSEGS
jgi:hypothetical protein